MPTVQYKTPNPDLPPAICIMGPTASGKSKLAMEMAKSFPVEIISVDSAQVYRHMDIGTAKPDAAALATVPHHLINLIDPIQRYSAAQFRHDALDAMDQITARGKIPLLIGGTMLYFRALQEGLSVLPPANEAIRSEIELTAKDVGWPVMHDKLYELDPTSAVGIKPTDSQRIQRALEVCYLTDKPMSESLKIPREVDLPYHLINIALIPSERSVLHRRIAQRFESMIATGLVEEVGTICTQFGVNAESPAMRCVGYRQALLYLHDKINLTEMHDMGIAATRQLAKRQLTWLRSMKKTCALNEYDCLAEDLSGQVLAFLQSLGLDVS
ncbi:MAG: tRNA (adenosine(37)-N6)-dimethylallyltransferase MiaA [Nitrosomonas sp.]|nr:tRNA (adenosine(37)-N6)-dimethylallyltransferase MiaA [Nitrosomonas sp.]